MGKTKGHYRSHPTQRYTRIGPRMKAIANKRPEGAHTQISTIESNTKEDKKGNKKETRRENKKGDKKANKRSRAASSQLRNSRLKNEDKKGKKK